MTNGKTNPRQPFTGRVHKLKQRSYTKSPRVKPWQQKRTKSAWQ